MALPQEKFRELTFQMLFGYDVAQAANQDELLNLLMKELAVTKKTVILAQEKVKLIIAKLPEIDEMIASTSKSYNFERIQAVERNILRLGVYEMSFDDSIPPKVAISESIRLARKFGTPESASFINAILDALYKISLGETIDAEKMAKTVADLKVSEERAHQAALESKNNE